MGRLEWGISGRPFSIWSDHCAIGGPLMSKIDNCCILRPTQTLGCLSDECVCG